MRRRGLRVVSLAGAAAALLVVAHGAYSRPTAAGNFTVAISAPQTITLPNSVPPKFPMTFTFAYVGPQLAPPPAEATTTFTIRLSEYMKDMATSWSNGGAGVDGCHTTYGPSDFYGPTWTEFSCTLHFTAGNTSSTMTGMIRPNGKVGTATTTVALSTGESASATTDIVHPEAPPPPPPPPPPPTAPPPISGPAAAPTQTVVETFTAAGQAEKEAVRIAPSAQTAQIALTWPDAQASFDVTGIQLVPSGRVLAVVDKRKPKKLKIKKIRKKRSLDVRIKNVRHGTLKFKIVAKKLGDTTRLKAKIRQSKR